MLLIKEDYYDDIRKFVEYNFKTLSDICLKCGYRPYGDIYKSSQDETICFDVHKVNGGYGNIRVLERELSKFINNFDFRFFTQPLTRPTIDDVRIAIFY